MASANRFFTGSLTSAMPLQEKKAFIDIGGNVFIAVSAALISHLHQQGALPKETFKHIESGFYHFFPQWIKKQAYFTAKERVLDALNQLGKSRAVVFLAYVLRQLALKEMCTNSLELSYRTCFSQKDAQTLGHYLNNKNSQLPVHAITQALEFGIALSIKAPGQELRVYEQIQPTGYQGLPPLIHLLVQQGKFFPQVAESFSASVVEYLPSLTPNEISITEEECRSIVTQVQQADLELKDHYREWVIRLNSLITTQEISVEQLKNCYLASLPSPAAMRDAGYVRHLTIDLSETSYSSDQPVIVNTLASLIAVDAVNVEELLEPAEQKSVPRFS